ncbi:MAG: CZB domain-containing protein [Thiobacillus sp.]
MEPSDWLRRCEAGEENPIIPPSENEETLEGLDLKKSIDAHLKWRKRLTDYLKGISKESLRVSVVACDDHCVLGKWIYGVGKQQFSHLKELEELRAVHTDFHLCAGNILLKHDTGESAAAEKLLNTTFKKLSNQIQLSLVRLHTKISTS